MRSPFTVIDEIHRHDGSSHYYYSVLGMKTASLDLNAETAELFRVAKRERASRAAKPLSVVISTAAEQQVKQEKGLQGGPD